MKAVYTRGGTVRVFEGVGVGDGSGRWYCQCDGSRPGQPAVTVRPASLPYCPRCRSARPDKHGVVPEVAPRRDP